MKRKKLFNTGLSLLTATATLLNAPCAAAQPYPDQTVQSLGDFTPDNALKDETHLSSEELNAMHAWARSLTLQAATYAAPLLAMYNSGQRYASVLPPRPRQEKSGEWPTFRHRSWRKNRVT